MIVRRPDVIFLATVGAMPVADEPELLEDVEGAVDGGRHGRRIRRSRQRLTISAPVT